MSEVDPLVQSYSHLAKLPRAQDALRMLKQVASLVKPIMRGRGWKVRQLTEFYPAQQNLLGLNVNRGSKICLRLRYLRDQTLFLPIEEVVDTMLHELAHIVHGPHDGKFHALWDQLRDEHESLAMKGYTGEGFLSEGRRLGGRGVPREEAQRMARAAAERRQTSTAGSGQRLGGSAPRPGDDMRRVIANAVERRNTTLQGCANDKQTQQEIIEIADTATENGFRTQAEEDAANETAIAQALWEMVQDEEKARLGSAYISPEAFSLKGDGNGGTGTNKTGGSSFRSQPGPSAPRRPDKKKAAPAAEPSAQSLTTTTTTWACKTCTLENPPNYLCCDACGAEKPEATFLDEAPKAPKRPRETIDLTKDEVGPSGAPRAGPKPQASQRNKAAKSQPLPAASHQNRTWQCTFCGRVRERQWWSCDVCGTIKESSR